VWIGNVRGSTYSQAHVSLNPQHKDFWRFSFEQMAEYDLPAFISHILHVTESKTLGYVGHSQGTVIMFALLSSQKKYNEIVKPFIALAPVASLKHFKTPIIQLAKLPKVIDLLEGIGGSFPPRHYLPINRFFTNLNCHGPTKWFCEQFIFMGAGYDEAQLDADRIKVYASHTPSPTSIHNIAHFVQVYKSGHLAKWDYGTEKNMQVYNQTKPPVYDIGLISSKYVALFHSLNDWCADPKDVQILKSQLKVPLFTDYLVPFKKWNHMDFVWGKEAAKYINSKVLEVLDRATAGVDEDHFNLV